MQTIISKAKAAKVLALGALCATLVSFTTGFGGEGFEIFINNKLVLQQFGAQTNTVKSLQLDQRFYNDQLTIKYFHCGKTGKDRTIMLKDDKNNVLKQWHFADAEAANNAMTCKVKDILDLQKKNGSTTINLFYSSSELPKGRLLVTVITGDNKLSNLQF